MPACTNCGFDPDEVVSVSYAFRIARNPPSLNDRLFNTGARAHLYRKERDAWCWLFREARLRLSIPFARTVATSSQDYGGREERVDRRKVTLTRMFGARQRERDHDNLVGGMKSIVDALVSERLIAGDGPADGQIYYAQKRSTLEPGLDVLIQVLA